MKNNIILIIIMLLTINIVYASNTCDSFNNNIVVLYTFDDNFGNATNETIIHDYSNNSLDGKVYKYYFSSTDFNSTYPYFVTGHEGVGLYNNPSGYIPVSGGFLTDTNKNYIDISKNKDYTLCSWIKDTNVTENSWDTSLGLSDDFFVDNQNTAQLSFYNYMVFYYGGVDSNNLIYPGSGEPDMLSIRYTEDNNWHFYCTVYNFTELYNNYTINCGYNNSGTVYIYRDGVDITNLTYGWNPSAIANGVFDNDTSAPVHFDYCGDMNILYAPDDINVTFGLFPAFQPYYMIIDNFEVLNKSLSINEINTLMNGCEEITIPTTYTPSDTFNFDNWAVSLKFGIALIIMVVTFLFFIIAGSKAQDMMSVTVILGLLVILAELILFVLFDFISIYVAILMIVVGLGVSLLLSKTLFNNPGGV